MSVRVSALVWKLDAPAGEKIVLLKMADCANDQGESIHPSCARVANECGCSERHVQHVWSKYRKRGLLTCDDAKGGRGKATTYAFDMDALKGETLAEFIGEKDATSAPIEEQKGATQTVNGLHPKKERAQLTALKGETGSQKGANDRNPPAPPIKENRQEPSLTVKGGGVGGGMVLPEVLDTEAFRSAWRRWLQFRKEDGHKLTPSTADSQIAKLSRAGHDQAIAMIEQSIEHGWQGLFPPKQDKSSPAAKYQDKLSRLEARL